LVGDVVVGAAGFVCQVFEGFGEGGSGAEGTGDGSGQGEAGRFGLEVGPGDGRVGAEGQVVGDLDEDVGEGTWEGFCYQGQGVLRWAACAEAGGQEVDREGQVVGNPVIALFGGSRF
jgi:hypothetical protein